MNKKLIFWLICMFMVGLNVQIVFAQPPSSPQTNVNIEVGIDVEYPKLTYFEQDRDIIFNFHLYNRSDGLLIPNTISSCAFHLYNPQGVEVIDNHTLERSSNLEDFIILINNSFTNTTGEYSYINTCNTSDLGGFVSTYFIINSSGEEPTLIKGIIYSILFIVFIVLIVLTILGAYSLDGENKYDFGGKLVKINVNKYIKIGLFFMSYLFLIVIFLFCEMIAGQFLIISFAEGIFHTLFILSVFGLFPIFIGTVVLWFLRIIADFYVYKLKKRGLKPR